MMLPRRMSLQLTPLFDMLLIVIFAQYLEVREEQTTVRDKAATVLQERNALQHDLQNARQDLEQAREDVQKSRQQQSSEHELLSQSQKDLDRALDHQRVLGELVVEMFQVPPEEIRKILETNRSPAIGNSPAERARIQQQFRDLGLQRAGRMIEHLLSYEEIRKRCDVWELHIDAKGVASISAGERSTRIRIPDREDGSVDINQLVNDLYAWYRSLPQPKSLVVILLTYDRASRIYLTEAVRQALPLLVARMQADSAGRTRFEYADLGFRLE